MSYVGGGTDIESFYRHEKGAVVSCAINKYMYITLHERFESGIRVSYSKTEEVSSVSDIAHPLVRSALSIMDVQGGIEITSTADIPTSGSGLGSSSSYTVGLLAALHVFKGVTTNPSDLAKLACKVEIDLCNEPIGKQDQYAASYGDLKLYEFLPDNSVNVIPVDYTQTFQSVMNSSTLIFYTGQTRSASAILKAQNENNALARNKMALSRMAALAYEFKDAIESSSLSHMAELLKENWSLKKSLASGISNDKVEAMYLAGIRAGALAGKLLGAGEGGFMMFLAPNDKHEAIAAALNQYRQCYFTIEDKGTEVIYRD